MRGGDKSIVIVSHDLNAIADLCSKCLILEKGKIIKYGDTTDIVSDYMEETIIRHQEVESREQKGSEPTERKLRNSIDQRELPASAQNAVLKILNLSVIAKGKTAGDEIMMSDEIILSMTYEKLRSEQTVPAFLITSPMMGPVMALTPERPVEGSSVMTDTGTGIFTISTSLPASFLNAGIYGLTVYFTDLDETDSVILSLEDMLNFKVIYEAYPIAESKFTYKGGFRGPLYPLSKWSITKSEKA
jgi:hypothetical protein